MTLNEVKKAILALDAHEVVHCRLDCFSPYAYIELPDDLRRQIHLLSDSDSNAVDEFIEEYLYELQNSGRVGAYELLSKDLD